MRWDSRLVAVARSWGLVPGFVAGLALAAATFVVGDVYVELPTLRDQVRILHLFPALAAVILPFPLVDRTPELTLVSARSPAVLCQLRLAGVLLCSGPLVGTLLAAGWSLPSALVVAAFIGVAAVACAVLGLWYWAPMMGLMVGWLHWGSRDQGSRATLSWLLADLTVVLVGGAVYVGLETARVRMRVRAAATSSDRGCRADTIRP